MKSDPDRANPDSQIPQVLTSQGRQTVASYLPQEMSCYRGNPFIEALPPIMTEDEAVEALARYPPYDESERHLPTHLRLHAMQSALQLFAPLPVHIDLEQRFSRMIRAGYQRRNPCDRAFWRDLDTNCKHLASSTSVAPNSARPIPLGFTIIGFPGVGKSTSVETVLSLYPQVIYHTRYNDHDLKVAQVVWLKLECPFDGSPKGLCMSFFQALDLMLGTNYEHNYVAGRRTTDELLPKMARVAAIHGLGVLAIDEINRLSGNKIGASRLLSFFVQLTNTIGVPVVLIGTFKAKFVLSGEFHQIRRGTGQGDLVWERMEEGVWVENDRAKRNRSPQPAGVWQHLLESFWRYQYTNVCCPLTADLSHVLYEETQGITDFAAKIFIMAQMRALVTASKPEVITADIIRSVARDSLKQAQPVLSALRQGKWEYLSQVPDINPIRIDDFLRELQAELTTNGPPARPGRDVTADPLPEQTPYGTTSPAPTSKPGVKAKSKRRKKGELPVYADGDLRAGLLEKDKTASAFESLQKAGHISSATDYLNETDAV
jgi:AAA domain-containing protein